MHASGALRTCGPPPPPNSPPQHIWSTFGENQCIFFLTCDRSSTKVKGQRQSRDYAEARVPYPPPGPAGWREERVLRLAQPLPPRGSQCTSEAHPQPKHAHPPEHCASVMLFLCPVRVLRCRRLLPPTFSFAAFPPPPSSTLSGRCSLAPVCASAAPCTTPWPGPAAQHAICGGVVPCGISTPHQNHGHTPDMGHTAFTICRALWETKMRETYHLNLRTAAICIQIDGPNGGNEVVLGGCQACPAGVPGAQQRPSLCESVPNVGQI